MNFKPRGSKKTFTLSSSLGNLDFEVSGFIKAIGQHPILYIGKYDKAVDGQIRKRQTEAWIEIGKSLNPLFGKLPDSEQLLMARGKLRNKWKVQKDTLQKSIRRKQRGVSHCSPYTFWKEMDFFIKEKGMTSEDFRYSDDENDENKLERPSEEQVPEKISSRKRRQDDVCIKNEALNQSFAEINKNSNKHNSSTPHSAKRLKQNNFHLSNISTRKSMRKSVNTTTAQESTFNDNDHSRSMIDPRFFCETTSNESINRDASERQEPGAEQVNNENISSGSFTQVDNTNALQIQSVYSSVEDEADRAFFESIKPSLRKMDPFKKLDFKIEVLQLLKKHLN